MSFVLLAASAQNKCTTLVWSCYVPSKGYHNKGEENSKNDDNNDNSNSIISDKKQSVAEKKDGVKEEVDNNEARGCDSSSSNNGGRNSRSSGSNGPHIEHSNLKSNLKKAVVEENNQLRTERRKVSWPDAHGKDIAHVQEFEPR
ncbi:hypothetical protein FEM48_Zijuj07G0074300 [Ziziphus jujuba var. spinosa]|uniref:Uncharacterized protein n=1 Tax=Ziziphus jujuba var. spinosa TaxID=714518 RepID=A0A978V3A3_ZIZJJ|nr:hypothetical protein FEM48_Zijuj07G0074300 [Ziziphus jujuba var. spinosa]